MPLSFHILTASMILDPLRSAALILLLFIILLIIVLIVPLNISLFLYKKGQLIEGRLMASWLGTSAGSELNCQESLVQGRVWISWLGIKLFRREIYAPSALDFISSITESRREDGPQDKRRSNNRQQDKILQDESQQAPIGDSAGSEFKRDSGGFSISLVGSVLAAIPAFIDLIGDLLRSFFFKTIRCHVQFGLDDPCDTAILSGRLWSVAAYLRCLGGDILIQPSFAEEKLEGELLAEVRFRPIHVPAAIISALRKKEIRALIKKVTGWRRRDD